jgi:hypothetical protein
MYNCSIDKQPNEEVISLMVKGLEYIEGVVLVGFLNTKYTPWVMSVFVSS